jgi:hypothetical protein
MPDLATLEIRGGKERTNNRTTLGGHIVVEGGDGSIFVYQGHVGMIEGGFSGVCGIGAEVGFTLLCDRRTVKGR